MIAAPEVTRTLTEVQLAEALHADLSYIARRLLFSGVALSESDRDFLADIGRSEIRYKMMALTRLILLSRRAPAVDDQLALSERVRSLCLSAAPCANGAVHVTDVFHAAHEETLTQGEADVAVHRFERFPDRATKETALQKLSAHWGRLRHLIDAVARTPVA